MELPPIIHDLAIIIVVSAMVSFLFHKLKWPAILGYLASGVLLGDNLAYDSPILNEASIIQLSELGVVFLMFYIGLEFDLKKLKTLISSSLLAVILQTIGMILIGTLAAPLLGWSKLNGLFLGGMLAISSTMVTISLLNQSGGLKYSYGQLALGVLILEDIVAIILLVIFAGIGASGHVEFMKIWQVVFFVGIFVGMVFFLGKLISPKLLKMLGEFDSGEMITLFTVAFMLGLGLLAEEAKFSLALGSFLAGAILAQSVLSHEIEKVVIPFKNLFSAVFFVTVGMMVQPNIILTYWKQIVFLAVLTVFGKFITVFLGCFLVGQNPKSSFKASLSKAQIGEFSFIIAALGQELGVVNEQVTAIIVGVSLVTILLTPLLNQKSDSLYEGISTRLPKIIINFSRFYINFFQTVLQHLGKSTILKLIRRPILQIIFYFLIFDGIILTASWGTGQLLDMDFLLEYESWLIVAVWVLTAFICYPFLVAVIRNFDAMIFIVSEAAFSNGSKNKVVERLKNFFHGLLLFIVTFIFSGIYLSAASTYFPSGLGLGLFVVVLIIVGGFAWNNFVKINSRLESLFLESLEHQLTSDHTGHIRELALQQINEKYPWPIQLQEAIINKDTVACGLRINELDLRQKSGAFIIGISRQGFIEYDPDPSTRIFPEDHLFIMGEAPQIEQALDYLGTKSNFTSSEQPVLPVFKLNQVYISKNSSLVGETLASSNIRKRYGVNVVGIQRNDMKMTSPGSEEMILVGDVLVVVGSEFAIVKFTEDQNLDSQAV